MKKKVDESKKSEAEVSDLEAELHERNMTATDLMDQLGKLREKNLESDEECIMLHGPKLDKLKEKVQPSAIADRTRAKRPDDESTTNEQETSHKKKRSIQAN